MQTIHSRRIIVVLLVAALCAGCAIHRPTIREYHTDRAGQINVSNVTEEQYWKERVDERIAELANRARAGQIGALFSEHLTDRRAVQRIAAEATAPAE